MPGGFYLIGVINMDKEIYNKLIGKLNAVLNEDKQLSDSIFIDKNMDFESLDEGKLMLVHTLLHKFYGSGNRLLTPKDIEKLHKEIIKKINHQPFDRLDFLKENEKHRTIDNENK